MSLKRNIVANYASQIYVTLIGIVMVPVYVRYMGAEAYGLVGFFAMLQAWFQLLDMGLTPTMARETARFNAGASTALNLRRLLRSLEGIFVGIAVLGAAGMIVSAKEISHGWLKVQHLPLTQVQHAIVLMAFIVALRWIAGLYRGAISGFERLVWLSGFNIAIATARFVVVIPLFIYVGTDPTIFFGYQLILAVIEIAILLTQTYRILPAAPSGARAAWEWKPLRGVLKFSLSIAFTSSVWVLVTQTDKLVLSKLLPLTDYAFFTLAVVVAGGVLIMSGPISGALLPRMTMLESRDDQEGLVRIYRKATRFVVAISIPVALMLAFFSEQVLWVWTGNIALARSAAPVLTLYSLGNGILALSAFPYYLQFAKGDLRLHLLGNALFVLLLIPSLIWATVNFGVTGAGYAWLISNSVYFLCWVPKVHSRFVPGLHTKWLLRDVCGSVVVTVITIGVAHRFISWSESRVWAGIGLLGLGLGTLAVVVAGSSGARTRIQTEFRTRLQRMSQ